MAGRAEITAVRSYYCLLSPKIQHTPCIPYPPASTSDFLTGKTICSTMASSPDNENKTLAPEENLKNNGDPSSAEAECSEKILAPEQEASAVNPKSNGDPSSSEKTLAPEKDANGLPSGTEGEDGTAGTLADADELFEKGSKAIEEGDFVEAVDCLSRALEIRVSHYGELAHECASSYYKYGSALLCKAQEETDPLGNVPNNSKQTNQEKAKSAIAIESSGSSKNLSSTNEQSEGGFSKKEKGVADEEMKEESDGEDADSVEGGEEEEESDLDLAWKMLDIARAILEKSPDDSMDKVNVYSALGEVSMEREDMETSLNDYLKALSILQNLVEPDHRRVVELNFRISLVLEIGSKVGEAIPYCAKAISLCKSRIEKLKKEEEASRNSETHDEIDLLTGILTELEKKLEDLEQAKANPSSVVSEVMKMIAAKSASPSSSAQAPEQQTTESMARSQSLSSSQIGTVVMNGFDSPSVSTATGGSSSSTVTHLGVVGRGVKRAVVKPIDSDNEPSAKKPNNTDSSAEK